MPIYTYKVGNKKYKTRITYKEIYNFVNSNRERIWNSMTIQERREYLIYRMINNKLICSLKPLKYISYKWNKIPIKVRMFFRVEMRPNYLLSIRKKVNINKKLGES